MAVTGSSGNLAPPSKGMLQPQKKCTHFMTLANLSKGMLLTALKIALSFNR